MARALVAVAEGSEELETVTTVDILRRAGIDTVLFKIGHHAHDRDNRADGDKELALAVRCSRGISLLADGYLDKNGSIIVGGSAIDTSSAPLALVLPGGLEGMRQMIMSESLLNLIREMNTKSGVIIAAICAAPMVLSAAGILSKDLTVTSYPSFKKELEIVAAYSAEDVVVDRHIITSRGPGTSVAFALSIVEKLAGPDACSHVASGGLFQVSK